MMATILFKEEVYNIVGSCMEVYNSLGYGFLEVVYKDAIEIEFDENDIQYEREKEFQVLYKGKTIKRSFKADFSLFNKIIVEIKTNANGISEDAIVQTLNYL